MITFFWHTFFYAALFLVLLVGVYAFLEWLKGKR